jgi:hypothetical protein
MGPEVSTITLRIELDDPHSDAIVEDGAGDAGNARQSF